MEWQGYWHQVFEARYTEILELVEEKQQQDPEHFYQSHIYKFFECVTDIILNRIFIDPKVDEFALGKTLGPKNKAWKRAKKGMPNRYRLFFQFSTKDKAIVLAWLNDETTLRKAGSKTDVYAVFKGMLKKGTIPKDFQTLLEESTRFPQAR